MCLREGRRVPTRLGVLGVVVLLASSCAVAGLAEARAPRCPRPGARRASEACVRRELGIPRRARRVLVLSQSSHLDWDWLLPFEEYFQRAVDGILLDALDLMSRFHGARPHYYYSIAEMGYLQRFVAAHPDLLPALRAVGQDLRIVGGGITSPDNLLPSGEAFIRDYLVGKTWIDQTLGLPIREAWLPDDFGHDSQLPIMLEAMGLTGVGFARVPGSDTSARFFNPRLVPPGSIAHRLLDQGIDFVWRAADGSQTLAHWMPGSYCQGDSIHTAADIQARLELNGPASPTPYVFVPIGCDFTHPKAALLDLVREWNDTSYQRTGVWAVAATFDHYQQLVAAHRRLLRERRFRPTPYWTGYYASRPALKSMHLAATQALLGAEIFGAIADGSLRDTPAAWRAQVEARSAAIHAGWAALVPGNHHDFITGTALDPVYQNEQLPRLADALVRGETERTRALGEIATGIRPDPANGGSVVVVFNQLGFTRDGLVEVSLDDPSPGGAQQSAEGHRLFMARVPSLGYATEALAADGGAPIRGVSLSVSPDGAQVVLENESLAATLSRDTGWGIVSLIDKRARRELIRRGQVGNDLVVYADQGGLYRFGDEMPGCTLLPQAERASGAQAMVLERGPLRARFVGPVTLAGRPFTKEYRLVAGEPFLRMVSTGGAPDGASVMVHFPLAEKTDHFAHGTPYHWDRKRSARAGQLSFEATHEFVIPTRRGKPQAAILHAGVPAWAVERSGLVVGALWRNAVQEQCDLYGARGTDPDDHVLSYALRVPTGVGPPQRGRALREALAFETPLLARTAEPGGNLPQRFSLASASAPAILTAAKAGTANPTALYLRVYQPSNRSRRVTIHGAVEQRFPRPGRLRVRGATALEEPLPAARAAALGLVGHPGRFRVTATRALTTIGVTERGVP
jgi:alpha-mannosidase